MAAMKFVYVLGVSALMVAVMVRADSGSAEDESSEERGRCYCDTSRRHSTCAGVTGSKVIGCPNTNSFRQCIDTNCTVQACPTGQVWNFGKNACSACDSGKHISANLQVCVCDKGTTFSKGACVKCPSGATEEADRCYCPSNLTLDTKNNACKACPAEAPIRRDRECECTNTTMFFNQDTWTCVSCPGTLTTPRRGRSSCRCTGANQIFYERNASCYTCPAGTTASRDNEECECARKTGLEFDHTTGACACKIGYTLNASGVCAKSTVNP